MKREWSISLDRHFGDDFHVHISYTIHIDGSQGWMSREKKDFQNCRNIMMDDALFRKNIKPNIESYEEFLESD